MKAFLASMLMVAKFIISDMTNQYLMVTQYTLFLFLLRVRIIRNSFLSLILGFFFAFPFLSAVHVNGKGCLGFFSPFLPRVKADFFILHPAPNCTGSDVYYSCAHLLLVTCEQMFPDSSFGAGILNAYILQLMCFCRSKRISRGVGIVSNKKEEENLLCLAEHTVLLQKIIYSLFSFLAELPCSTF